MYQNLKPRTACCASNLYRYQHSRRLFWRMFICSAELKKNILFWHWWFHFFSINIYMPVCLSFFFRSIFTFHSFACFWLCCSAVLYMGLYKCINVVLHLALVLAVCDSPNQRNNW